MSSIKCSNFGLSRKCNLISNWKITKHQQAVFSLSFTPPKRNLFWLSWDLNLNQILNSRNTPSTPVVGKNKLYQELPSIMKIKHLSHARVLERTHRLEDDTIMVFNIDFDRNWIVLPASSALLGKCPTQLHTLSYTHMFSIKCLDWIRTWCQSAKAQFVLWGDFNVTHDVGPCMVSQVHYGHPQCDKARETPRVKCPASYVWIPHPLPDAEGEKLFSQLTMKTTIESKLDIHLWKISK